MPVVINEKEAGSNQLNRAKKNENETHRHGPQTIWEKFEMSLSQNGYGDDNDDDDDDDGYGDDDDDGDDDAAETIGIPINNEC
jgi:hypothetical protein